MSFDNDRIVVPASPSINIGTSDFSIEFWLETADSNSADIIAKSVGSGQSNPTDESWFYVRLKDQGYLEVEITDGYSQAGDYSLITSNSSVNNGELNFISIVFDRDGYGSIYINGELDNSSSISSHSGDISNPYDLEIGVDTDLGNYYLDGILDNMMIWGKVLSDNEIISHFNNIELDDTADLLAYWKFNEGEGDIAYDHSGNQNHGTIYGAEWVENEVLGCTDELACNYDEEANTNNGSCDYICYDIDNSLSFDGANTYVEIPHNNQLNLENEGFTIFTRVMFKAFEDQRRHQILTKSEGSGGNKKWIFGLPNINSGGQGPGGSTNGLVFHSHTGGNDRFYARSNEFTPELYKWYDIAVSSENGNYTFYIDGNYWGLDEGYNNVLSNNADLLIGAKEPNEPWDIHSLDGNIDELVIWNTYLTAEQIFDISYNGDDINSYDIEPDNIVANWQFNQHNSGELNNEYLVDESGNQNHGIIYGAEWVENPLSEGCTDPLAENYNSEATIDNGSCNGIVDSEDFTYSGELNGHYYYLSNNLMNWHDAVVVSAQNNGHLVTITSQEENNFVSALSNYENIYIGLTDQNEEGVWEWVTSEPFSFSNWVDGEPNDGDSPLADEDWVHTNYSGNGDWNDDWGDSNFFAVLELESGCTDELACNYQSYAYQDDGSCDYDCNGNENIHLVPQEFESIQNAIDYASDGDEILVSQGSYAESLSIDKSINLRCVDDGQCMIDGNDISRVVIITGSDIVVDGFNIVGNNQTKNGIVIYPDTENIEIKNNVIYGMAMPTTAIDPFSYGVLVFGDSTDNMPTDLSFTNNEIFNVSGGGIVLGQYTDSIDITENYIHDLNPIDFLGFSVSYGVGAELTSNLNIADNTFENLFIGSNIFTTQAYINNNYYENVDFLLLTALSAYDFDESIFWYNFEYSINYQGTDYLGEVYTDSFDTANNYSDDGSTILDSDGNQYNQNCFGDWVEDHSENIGDVNQDGGLNVSDILIVISYIFNEIELNNCQVDIADINEDGLVNIYDIIILVSVILSD